MMGLLPQARRLLAYIVTMERQGDRWTYRTAATHLDQNSTSSVYRYADQLLERGYVQRTDGRLAPTAAGFGAVPRLEGYRFVPAPHDVVVGRAVA